MTNFFSGWLGYGVAIQSGTLVEPSDPAYQRCPYILGDMDGGIVSDVGSGTVGPATVAWGPITYKGIFDAQVGGNLLLWLPMRVPVNVNAGNTITTGTRGNTITFPDLAGPQRNTFVWPAGATIAKTVDGRFLTSGVALQLVAGTLSAQAPAFGGAVTMGGLPSAPQTTGSGLLWNNGGVISVS